jgi:hypothetical protein
MTKDVYDKLTESEKAMTDGVIMIFRELQKTNALLEAILKNE